MISKKIRIAIFHCGFVYSGGGERIVLEEAKGLVSRGYEVEIFAPTLDKKLCFPQEVKRLGVKTFLPQLPSIIPGRFALQMVLSSLFAPFLATGFVGTDIFLGENQPGAWIAYCISKVLKKPYIVYMNQPNRLLYHRKIDEEVKWKNLSEYLFIDSLIKKLRFFVAWADRTSFVSGKSILTNGSYIGSVIKKIYKKEVVDCPAGAYPQEFKKLRLNPETSYKGSLKVGNVKGKKFLIRKPYVLLTNRHVPQKKFEHAIAAMKGVVKKYPNILLVIPGPFTAYTLELKKIASSFGVEKNVLFLNQVPEDVLQKLYQSAAVYVYTAPEEDFGMGLIEAMGWGVPPVAWNFAGPTVTVSNGEAGYLAKPYDVEDFAQKIISILANPQKRSKMGKKAWERVSNNFSWDNHLNILENEIKKALD